MEAKTVHKVILVFVGISSVVMAILGLAFSLSLLYTVDSTTTEHIDQPYFLNAFYIMTAICISFLAIILITGIQLIRGKIYWANILLLIVTMEIIYNYAAGKLWLHPVYGPSIAAATGIANGGLYIQLATLFIIWAPALAMYAKFITNTGQKNGTGHG